MDLHAQGLNVAVFGDEVASLSTEVHYGEVHLAFG